MSLTDIALLAFILLFILYAVYDEIIMPRRNGKTRLQVNLKRRNKADSGIFVGLLAILAYQNINNNGSHFTTWLLFTLAIIAIYVFIFAGQKSYLKKPVFITVMFYFIQPHKNMNMSEDGYLVIDLEKRRLLIQVAKMDDLDLILKFFVEQK